MSRFLPILVAAAALFGLVATSQAGAATSLADSHVAHGSATGRASNSDPGCSGADDASAPIAIQEQAMLCLTNQARHSQGLAELSEVSDLDRSAGFKSGDIIRCDSFSHEACGREFTFWMQKVGYIPAPCWRAGENIAWGTGSYGTVGSIFSAWMHSAGHRENILGSYSQIGIGLRVGGLDGHGSAHVWTQQFGLRC
jgi:uncharacterized protein YkwD